MSIEENKRAVRRFFDEAWNQKRVSELDEYLSADNIHYFGVNKARLGPKEVRAIMDNWHRGFNDFRYHVEHMVGEGDHVAVHVRFTGTHTGLFEIEGKVLEPTNSKIDEAEMFIYHVVDGKIVESWAVWNRLGVLQQLGAAA